MIGILFASVVMCITATKSISAIGNHCIIEDGRRGECVPFYSCDSVLALWQRIRSGEAHLATIVRNRGCRPNPGSTTQHVCCPLSGLQILEQTDCGLSSHDRVAGGNESYPAEIPWMALIGTKQVDTTEPIFFCGGSLITTRYVLSAAHCTQSRNSENMVIRLGEHNLLTQNDCVLRGHKVKCYTHKDYNVEEVIQHPDFRGYINDIALLRLSEDVVIKDNIFPVCLPYTDLSKSISRQQEFYISGWGLTEHAQERSNILMKAVLNSQPVSDCQTMFPKYTFTDDIACMSSDMKAATCKGDSGGPVFVQHIFRPSVVRYIQYGVMFAGLRSCGEKVTKTPYVNLIQYITWVSDNIK